MSASVVSPIGQRIVVVGASGTGKSTLAERLAGILDVPFVELDALNWEPNWVGLNETNPEEFERRIREATAADGWVVAGSYRKHSEVTFWPRLETVVWLDLSLPVAVWRVFTRSWRRSRRNELLWGTNYEKFWPQLKVWDQESLIWWVVRHHRGRQRRMVANMSDPRWQHIRFVRLRSQREIDEFVAAVVAGAAERVEVRSA